MAYLITDNTNRITGIITIGGKPEETEDQHIYEIYVGDIPSVAIPNLELYSYDGHTFTRIPETEIKQYYINEYKNAKIETLSGFCNFFIISGIDVNGEHYSLQTEDQMNIMRLGLQAMSPNDSSILVYHSDGKPARIYSKEEMEYIYHKAVAWINYHVTYYNLLKQYINTLENVNDVLNINYNTPLPEEYNKQLHDFVDVSPYEDFSFVEIYDTNTYDYIITKIDATQCIEDYKKTRKKIEEEIKQSIQYDKNN